MNNLFSLEVEFSNMQSIIVGDEVIVDSNIAPRGNGKDIAVFVLIGEEKFISAFTRFGNQIILIGENGQIQVVKASEVHAIGTVVGGSFEMDEINRKGA